MSKNLKIEIIVAALIIVFASVNFIIPQLPQLNEKKEYKISTVDQVCELIPAIYNGFEYQNYQSIIRSHPESGRGELMLIMENAHQQFLKDIIWNYDIHPDLWYVVDNHSGNCE